MVPPAWAYQVNNFDPPPDEELVCTICHGILCDPVQLPCNHVYCRNCIYKWLVNNEKCPICREKTCQQEIKEVVPLIKNIIMKLTLKCHNLERGCEEKFSLEGCEAHLKECIYEIIACSNCPCKEMVLRRDIKDHELKYCLHQFISCKNCGLKIPRCVTPKHNCVKDLRERLKSSMKIIKKNKQQIIDLKKEVQTVKENFATSSTRYFAENVLGLSLPSNSEFSFRSDSSASSSEAGEESQSEPFTGDNNTIGLAQHLTQRNSFSAEESLDQNDSVEVIQTSTPNFPPIVSFEDLIASSRSLLKRRLYIRLGNSSMDASSEVIDVPPSTKRARNRLSTRSLSDNLTSIPETAAGPSSVATTSAATNDSYLTAMPSLLKTPDENETSVTAGATVTPKAENEPDSSFEIPLPSREVTITTSDADDSVMILPNIVKFIEVVTLSSDDDDQ